MFKKVKRTRAFVCLLVMFAVLLVWGFAENAVQAPAADGAAEATVEEALDAPAEETLERDLAAANGETDFAGGTVRVIEAQEEEETTQIDFVSGMTAIWESTGLANGDWQQYVMILIAFVLLYLAIVKGFEPLLLLPISFGMLLANLPLGGLMDDPTFKYFATLQEAQQYAAPYGKEVTMVSKMFWDVGGQVFTSESRRWRLVLTPRCPPALATSATSIRWPTPTADCSTTSIRASSWASTRRSSSWAWAR